MTALLLDVGNSRLKWGVAKDGEIRRSGHIAQQKIRDQGLQILTTKLPRGVDEVMVSNVAGQSFATRLSGVLGAHCNVEVHFARCERRGWGITNAYRQPRLLGVDRWVAMIGAWNEIEDACVVVDAGTAVTIDAIDHEGQHLGGQIIAGTETMLQSLASATSDIPPVRASKRRSGDELAMFGKNTRAALREGAQNAIVGAVERALRCLQDEGYDPQLILTGGGASRILDALDEDALHKPHLVLQGLQHMLENAK